MKVIIPLGVFAFKIKSSESVCRLFLRPSSRVVLNKVIPRVKYKKRDCGHFLIFHSVSGDAL